MKVCYMLLGVRGNWYFPVAPILFVIIAGQHVGACNHNYQRH